MKRYISLTLLLSLIFPGCSHSVNYQSTDQILQQYYQEDAPPNNGLIVIEDITVNGIGLSYDLNLVKERIGSPNNIQKFDYHEGIKEISGNKYPHEIWSYDGLKIEFVNSKVSKIEVYSNSYQLSNDIQINDSVKKLKELKGFDHYFGGFRTESGATFYNVTEKGKIANITISIMYD